MAGEQDIEYVLSGITQILSSSAKEILPCKRNRPILRPYWNNDLKNARTKSRECRRKWIVEGRPGNSDNAAFREYKAAKCEFRKLLRRKCFEHERNEFSNMDEFYDKDRSRFQKEISAKQKSYSGVCNELKIDGRLITEKEELLSVWKAHYEQLYMPKESPVYDEQFKVFVEQQLKEYVDLSANVTNDVLETPFTTEEVSNLCLKLPNNKVGGMDELVYEHVKYAGKQFFVVLTDVFNAIRALEAIPESVEIGVIYSLFKGKKKNKLDKDNYRGITLLNVIGKILERLILDRMMPILIKNGVPDKMQFAYQKGKSCVQASFVLQEAIHHAVERESKVYACFLDISKAFDCVWMDGLFFKLFNLGIQGKSWRLLKKWYSNLSCRVAHNDLLSEPFLIRQGIRQGGVISPWLFLCFNNDINAELSTMNVGINIDSLISVKNVLIADDVALLSLSVNGLQKMISTMEAYSKKWRFDYNVTKTNIITFGEHVNTHRRNVQQRCWTLYGKQIKEKLSSEHAGIRLSGNFSSTERTLEMARKGKAVVSSLMSAGVRPAGLNPICGINIWTTVGLPTMLFGGELWSNITKTEYDILERVNRFAAKRAQGLAPSTRSEAALGSLGLWTIEGHIDKVQLMFLHKLLSLKSTNVDKIIFVVRLSSFFNGVTKKKMGFIPNIVRILNKYGLGDYLTTYIQTGQVQTKSSWKSLVKASIHQFQLQSWRQGLHIKPELGYFRDVHTELQPLELWNTAKRNPMYIKPIATLVNLLCGNIPSKLSDVVEDQGEQKICRICHGPILGTLKHFIMDCQSVSIERELLWDNLQDQLSLNICASIFNQDDNGMLASFLSGSLPCSVSDSERDQFIIICSNGIVAIFLKIEQFLNSIVHS
jgi:hypothetical protein